MTVLVCGSRSWTDIEHVRERLGQLPPNTTILHGAANGADKMADKVARELGFMVQAFPAEWSLGRQAGFVRNMKMIHKNPAFVIAFWDGKSRGTHHTIHQALKHNLRVEIIHPRTRKVAR